MHISHKGKGPNDGPSPYYPLAYLPVDERGEVEVVEDVHAVLPGVGVPVLAHALLVEAVHLCVCVGGGGKGDGG